MGFNIAWLRKKVKIRKNDKKAREEAEERQGDESGPKCLHHITPPGPGDGRRCPAHAEAERHDGEDGVHAAVVDVEGAVRHEEVREVPHAPPGVAHALRRVAPA